MNTSVVDTTSATLSSNTMNNNNKLVIDPQMYHAKPSDFDISQKALKRPRCEETTVSSGTIRKSNSGGGKLSPSLYIFKKESFSDLSEYLPARLIEILEKEHIENSNQVGLGLSSTTKIQSVVIRFLLEGITNATNSMTTCGLNTTTISTAPPSAARNINKILIKSQTGSGKTLSYLIPIVAAFTSMNATARQEGSLFASIHRTDGTRALIVVPTRELCNQVTNVSTKIINYCCCNVVIGNVTGGEKRKSEKARLRKGITILIVTPGRFLDHLRTTESLNLKRLQFIVLDEIDKLLELGESTLSSEKAHSISGVTTSGGFGTGSGKDGSGSGSALLNESNAVYEILKIILQGDLSALLNFGVNKDVAGSKHSSANRQASLQSFINMHNASYEEKYRQQQFLSTRTVHQGVAAVTAVAAESSGGGANHNDQEEADAADAADNADNADDKPVSSLPPIPPSTPVKLIMVTATLTNLVKKMANKILMNDQQYHEQQQQQQQLLLSASANASVRAKGDTRSKILGKKRGSTVVKAVLAPAASIPAKKTAIIRPPKPSMAIIDGEKESIYVINSISTLEKLGRDSGRLDGSLVGGGGGGGGGGTSTSTSASSMSGVDDAPDIASTNAMDISETTAAVSINAIDSSDRDNNNSNEEDDDDENPLYAPEPSNINRGTATKDGCISFIDDDISDSDADEEEEEDNEEEEGVGSKGGKNKGSKISKGSRHSLLATGERMDDSVPKQLAQYFMVVTCKWRLAALLSFLKLHTTKNEKVIVFFSTCDSVDYHALLLKQAGLYNYKGKGGVDRSSSSGSAGLTTKLDMEEEVINWPTDFEDRERRDWMAANDPSHFHNNADILNGMDIYNNSSGHGSGNRELLNPFNHKQRIDAADEFGGNFKNKLTKGVYPGGDSRDAKQGGKSAFGHKGGKDAPVGVVAGKDGAKKDSKNGGNRDKNQHGMPSAKDILEPLESKFKSKLFGRGTTFYRLHGNVPNHIRQSVYKDFCNSTSGSSVLLCTDVAARGLDLPLVSWILQYDPPSETIDYIHRVGRTARRGQQGSSLLFLLPTELPYVQLLSSHGLSSDPLSLQQVFLDVSRRFMNYDRLLKKYGYGSAAGGESSKVDEISAVIIQKRMEQTVAANNILCSAGKQAFRSFVRAYATHTNDYVANTHKKNKSKLKLGNGLDADMSINKSASAFSIHNLHLGHVAKSFALLDQPSQLRNTGNHHDDVIGQIFNCMYSADKFASRRPGFGSSSGNSGGSGKPEFANINPHAPVKRVTVPTAGAGAGAGGNSKDKDNGMAASQQDLRVAEESAAALTLLKKLGGKSDSNISSANTTTTAKTTTTSTSAADSTATSVSAYAGMATENTTPTGIFNDKIVNPTRPVVAMQKIRKLSAFSNTTTNAKKSGNVRKNDDFKGRFNQAQSGDLKRKMNKKHMQTMSEFQA